jgi:periplasmic protein TonB
MSGEWAAMVQAWFGNRVLAASLLVSMLLHAGVLAVRFVDPELFQVRQSDPELEVVLVNAKSATRPTKAQALAQANLDGGGSHDNGRRKSPLPNMGENREGDTLEARHETVESLEQEQRQLLAMVKRYEGAKLVDPNPDTPAGARHTQTVRQQLARMQAEIAKEISDYQQRPRRHHFMPSTSEYRFARYFEDWRARIEKVGNEHYPEEARGHIYGSLQMTVVIDRNGNLVDAILDRSSGSQVLDRAARRIVKLAAPYPPFPPDIARDTDVLEITRTWIFTNDQFGTRPSGDTLSAATPPAPPAGQ